MAIRRECRALCVGWTASQSRVLVGGAVCLVAAGIVLLHAVSWESVGLHTQGADNLTFLPQHGEDEELSGFDMVGCGPSVLYFACRSSGQSVPLGAVQRLVAVEARGSNMWELKRAARELGFDARAIEGAWSVLAEHLRCPRACAILHVNGRHFVLASASPERNLVRIADCALGVYDFEEPTFRDTYSWEGKMLLLRPTVSERRNTP